MNFFKKKKKIILIIGILIVGTVIAVIGINNLRGKKEITTLAGTTAAVTKGNIKVEISGSGVIEPVEQYDITPLVSGKIVSAPFEEGQKVKKDDILYKLDATEVEGNIQKTQNSIERLELSTKETRNTMEKTVIYAGASGRLTNFTIKENESIGSNKLGDIVDDSYCIARVPFSESQINQIKVGQSATVNSPTLMASIEGTVSKISTFSTNAAGGVALYDVEITIKGSSSLIKDTAVTAVIAGMESPDKGKIDVPEAYSVTSPLAGRVKKVYVSNNDSVVKGQKLFELENDSYLNTLDKSNLDRSDLMIALESQKKQLENYNIKAPIDGIVLEKNKKTDDTINAGMANGGPLMVIADMSKVKFNMKIDELDISKIKIGQSVTVLADALPDQVFIGEVTSIAGKGTAANGVSNYLVQVTIKEPGGLKPGMNVNAKTIVAEKENILMVPASAVSKKEGKAYVNVPSKSADGKNTQSKVDVEIGINNKDFVEIVKGLNEGDEIVIPPVAKEITRPEGGIVID